MTEQPSRPMSEPLSEPMSPYGSYQPPAAPPVGAPRPADEKNWAVAAHLSGFVAAWFALGFLGPLVVLLTAGSRSPFIRRHAVEALNFNLSVLIYVLVGVLLLLVLIGIPLLLGVGALYIVASIMGAVAAARGDEFRYPLTIRFIS